MNEATVFITSHPWTLTTAETLVKLDGKRSRHVLVNIRHPYINNAMIERCAGLYDHVVLLPNIDYLTNIIKGIHDCLQVSRAFSEQMLPILDGIEQFSIISACSAYLPENFLLTKLRQHRNCKRLISFSEDCTGKGTIGFAATARAFIYVVLFGLTPVCYDKLLGYRYIKEPRNLGVKLISPFENPEKTHICNQDGTLMYFIRKPFRKRQPSGSKRIVLFYSDRDLSQYKSVLSAKEQETRMEQLLNAITAHYRSCILVCKPHPLDKGRPIDMMERIPHELYNGVLSSEMYVEQNFSSIVACYAVSSVSLLHTISAGIPTYTLYKYLGFASDGNLRTFFENDIVKTNPYLLHVTDIKDVGRIDSMNVEPTSPGQFETWERIRYPELLG